MALSVPRYDSSCIFLMLNGFLFLEGGFLNGFLIQKDIIYTYNNDRETRVLLME